MSTTKTTYEVKRGFFLNQQFIGPAAAGEPARTITLTEREARYHLLAGDISQPAATPAVNTPSNAS